MIPAAREMAPPHRRSRRSVLGGLGALALPLGPRPARAGAPAGAFADFLARYRVVGADGIARLRYGSVNPADRAALAAFIEAQSDSRPSERDPAEAFAFWANLYNALTLALILDHYPVASIRDIRFGLLSRGPWGRALVTVEGKALSLDDIEHGILRTRYAEPRVHYAVNCASLGCPDLPAAPFTGAGLEAELDAAAAAYVNHPRGVRFAGEGPSARLTLSRIYQWYAEDFGGEEAGVLGHLRAHAAPGLASRLEARTTIDAYAYDWSLNDAP